MIIDPVYTVSLIALIVLAVASIALGPRSERLPRWAAYIVGCAVIWAAFAAVQVMRPSSGLAAVTDLTIIMVVSGAGPLLVRAWVYIDDLQTAAKVARKRNE